MAAISSLTTRSGKPRALSGAAIRMLGHDDGEPTRIGDSLRTVSEGDAHGAAGTFLSGRRDSLSPMLKHSHWSVTSADGSGWRASAAAQRVNLGPPALSFLSWLLTESLTNFTDEVADQ